MYSVSVRDTWNSQSSLRNMARSGEQYSGEQMELWGETNQTDVQKHVTNMYGSSPHTIDAFCISQKPERQRELQDPKCFELRKALKIDIN